MQGARVVWIFLALVLSAVAAQAGLYAPAENALQSPEGSFAADTGAGDSTCATFEVGAAAVDVTPGEKTGDTYALWQEPFIDANGNGVYDAPDPIGAMDQESLEPLAPDPFVDQNGNGKWDGPFMAGYGHEKAGNEYYVASAVHDPVWARAVSFTCGGTTVGLVSVDTVGLFRGFVLDVREEAPPIFDHVIVASTHTHDSVDTMGLWGPNEFTDGKDPRTLAHYKAGILEALADAYEDRAAVGSVRIGSNLTRHLIPVTGPIQTDLRDPFVIDDRVVAVQFRDAAGDAITTVVNWSPHPETLAGTRSEISSDYPDKLRRAIESEGATVNGTYVAPAGGTAVFVSGAVGGMMTTLGAKPRYEDGTLVPDHSYAKAERIGEIAAWVARSSLENATARPPPDGLSFVVREANVAADNPFLLALNTIGVFDHEVALGPVLVPAVGEPGVVAPIPFLRVEVDVVTLTAGDANVTQILTVPGELLPEVALGNPLGHDAVATQPTCFAFDPWKLAFNAEREGKPNPTDNGNRTAGFARVLAARPSYPKEPAILDHADAEAVLLLGLANDELGYIVPADDYELATIYPDTVGHGRDRCGDNDHYEETNSASSLLAVAVANLLVSMLDDGFVPAALPTETAGFLAEDGSTTPVPGWETRGVWVDSSRSGGYESQEDARVTVNLTLPSGLPGCWGFVNGHGQDLGQEPHAEMRGFYVDWDGDCRPTSRDALFLADNWAVSEGQPYWRP